MPKHSTKLDGWDGDLRDLAISIENLRYDKCIEFLMHLENAFLARSKSDLENDKPELSEWLRSVADNIACANYYLSKAWDVCKQHMKEEEK